MKKRYLPTVNERPNVKIQAVTNEKGEVEYVQVPIVAAYATETKNCLSSKEPFSSLAASNDTGTAYYVKRLQAGDWSDYPRVVNDVVSQLEREASVAGWKISPEKYDTIARLAIARWLHQKHTQDDMAFKLRVSLTSYKKSYANKIKLGVEYLKRMGS